jgi:hypothetical protein
MSYVVHLHHVTPENEMIFWLLCYCQTEQWSQARSSAFDILWIAGRDWTYGDGLPWLRDIIAGFSLFHSCVILAPKMANVHGASVAR